RRTSRSTTTRGTRRSDVWSVRRGWHDGAMTLAIGDPAPDFTLKDQYGQDISLSAYAERKAFLLVFYPFAFSGVCTGELTGLRDRLGDFETDHTTLVAVSCDP